MNRNYKIFLISNSILSFAFGFYSPFYIIFVRDFGNVQQFGFSVGLMTLAFAIASYFGGKYSDKFGRKAFLITSGFIFAGVIISYTFIESINQLYILQIIYGIASALNATMEASFLGDVTKMESRGLHIGKYRAITNVIESFAIMGGGFVVGILGYKSIFYIAAVLVTLATGQLFFISKQNEISNA